MESQQGLEFMLNYIRGLLEEKPIKLENVIAEMSKTLALSLLSDKVISNERLVETYFVMLSKMVNIASTFVLEKSKMLKKMKESIANLLAGLALNRNGDCVFVKILCELQLPGMRVKLTRGSTACIEPLEAVLLEAGGFVEILLIGRLSQVGRESEGGDSRA
ncbi:MAG TPA: hypothetical protein EYP08_03845 [Pyrodictiaceae archaeon]|nr:hypothetical protein [Pyrodictiaceae archaeon]